MFRKCKLTFVSSKTHKHSMRTPDVLGWSAGPEAGKCVIIVGQSLANAEEIRAVFTTVVLDIMHCDAAFELQTQNSRYVFEWCEHSLNMPENCELALERLWRILN